MQEAVVRVMKLGYLSDSDAIIRVDYRLTDDEIAQLVRQEFTGMARVHSIHRPKFGPVQPEPAYDREYIRMMSQGG